SQGLTPSWPVTRALFMAPRSLEDVEWDQGLARPRDELMTMRRPRSEGLFSLGGQRLPCWLPDDDQPDGRLAAFIRLLSAVPQSVQTACARRRRSAASRNRGTHRL